MDWTQAFIIIGVLGAFTFWLFTKLDKDITDTKNSLDSSIKHLTAMQAEQSKRTDKLYDIFMKSQEDYHNKFYDLLKGKKGN